MWAQAPPPVWASAARQVCQNWKPQRTPRTLRIYSSRLQLGELPGLLKWGISAVAFLFKFPASSASSAVLVLLPLHEHLHGRSRQRNRKHLAQRGAGNFLRPGASEVAPQENSRRDEQAELPVHLARFVVLHERENAGGRQQHGQ